MRGRFWLIYLLLVAAQILMGNFLNLGQLITVCLLPILVLSLPITYSGPVVMIITFVTSLAVDFFTHGILGLGTVALLPVAAGRYLLISSIFGGELYSRGEDISIRKQGVPKVALAIFLATAVYFAIYVWVDAAGTRSIGFNTLRWLLSTIISTAAQILLTGLLNDREDGRWK